MAIYVEGAVQKEGVFLVEKGCAIKNLLERTGLKPEAVSWKKLYRKRFLIEPGSFFVPGLEDFSPSWDNTVWMEHWQQKEGGCLR